MTEKDVFTSAREMTDPAARSAYVDGACAGDRTLRDRVEALLRAQDQPDSLLDQTADATVGLESGAPTDDEIPLGFLAPSTQPDALGRIGHYDVLEVLGKGAFGIVFRALDDVLQRVVAVKVLAPQLAATSPARKRFLREARTSAAIRHENVVQVHAVEEKPLPYLVMEFIPGETLQQKLDRVGPLDVPETLRIGRQIAEGLSAAHATDLIHRDIKPGNILLEGAQQKAKLTDFGLARAADDASISQSGIIAGTPMYMAPEQALGHKIDQRADLFSLGSVLYQMVAGRPPFRANSTVAVLKRVAEDTPRDIREIIPETPQWLCDIIAKLHAKNPDERYQSAREVADMLADCEAQLKAKAKLKDYSRIPRSQPLRTGRRKWLAAAAALLLLLIALSATELTGVTHLFHQQLAVSQGNPTPNPATSPGDTESESWVQLFNGKDLTGWKTHPDQPGQWKVDGGVLIGSAVPSYLYSEGGHFADFQLRIEARINNGGDSGIYLRTPFATRPGRGTDLRPAGGYEVELQENPTYLIKTGSVWDAGTIGSPPKSLWINNQPSHTRPDEWFTLEILATGNHFVTKVNGTQTADCRDPQNHFDSGHIALQVFNPLTIVQFRKIEIKELPVTAAPLKYGDPEYTNALGMKFKLIPAGKFTMGSSQEEIDRCLKQLNGGWLWENLATEGPEHPVEIARPFYLGATEVTVGQFRQFVDEEGYQVGDGRWRNPGFDQTDQHPVVWVSWNNAVDFCKWLSKKEGKEYRLPTEAEWEYSCRAGKAGSRYCFGDDDAQLDDYTWFNQNSRGGTHPVGKKKPNAWGLYDMHGNASEHCQDNYDPDYYKSSPVKDPPGGAGEADRNGARAGRGGGWKFGPVICRSAFRGYSAPDQRWDFCGFRVLLVSPPASVGTEIGTKDKTSSTAIAPFTDADVQRIAALPAAEQVEEVRKELKRRNPGFDGQMETKIKGGVVTDFKIETDHVADIAPIRVFNALRVLECNGTSDIGGPHGLLADLTPLDGMNLAGLTKLSLQDTKVTDAALVYFKECRNLTGLSLSNTKVTDAGMLCFKDCKNLTVLSLAATKVGDAGLANFKNCTNLTFLGLGSTRVSDAGLIHLKDCKDLKQLRLDCTNVTDKCLANIKGMPIRLLWIDHTDITDLTPLQGMPLEDIRLTPTNITKSLAILRDMKSLKTIGIEWNQLWPSAEFWERYDKGEFK